MGKVIFGTGFPGFRNLFLFRVEDIVKRCLGSCPRGCRILQLYGSIQIGAPLIEKSSFWFLVDTAVLGVMDLSNPEPQAVPSLSINLSQFPLVVLLKILSFLSLENVLQLERQCRHLHHAVSAYLTTLKTFHERILEDQFWRFDPHIVSKPSDSQLASLLCRCPSVTKLVFLHPSDEPGKAGVDQHLLSILIAHKNITEVEYCSSLPVAETVFEFLPLVTITTCTLSAQGKAAVFSLPSGCRIKALRLHRVVLVGGIPSLPVVEEIKLSNVKLTESSKASQQSLEFPRLQSFSFFGSPPAPSCFTQLLVALTKCPLLTSLKLGLSAFDGVEDLLQEEGLSQLSVFELRSIGLYTATFQQYRFAGTVAELCTKNASSVEHLSLPSSILTKQFFRHFIDNNIFLPKLKRLDVNGIADTKLFLAPGNLVESRYYRDFLRLCPQMASLSLHCFSGSLTSLALPMTLTEVTLPWDNRLNLNEQRDSVHSVLAAVPGLQKLSIAGVEEVEGIVLEGTEIFRSVEAPELKISSDSLLEFTVSNACIKLIDLKGCAKLSAFALHCCPILKSLTLPADPLKRIYIYDSCRPYVKNFIKDFVSQRECSDPCHLHVQLHSVRRVTDMTEPPEEWGKWLLVYVTSVLASVANRVDYFVVRQLKLWELEHNSGEPMFPCTEFHPEAYRFRRSEMEIESVNEHRSLALAGVRRWLNCLSNLKQFVFQSAQLGFPQASPCDFTAHYCSEDYGCYTNIPWVTNINQSFLLSQPSSPPNSDSELRPLNVPRLDVSTSQCYATLATPPPPTKGVTASGSEKEPPKLNRPLVVISVMEFVHNIHTLFYPS